MCRQAGRPGSAAGTSSARKTDLADACSVAAAALHHRRLRPVTLEDQTVILRLLSDRRDDLVAERTAP
jgi:transposase